MKKRFFTVCMLLSSLFVFAQQNNQEKKDTSSLKLNEVVVTAQRNQQQNLLVPYTVNTLGRKAMDDYQFRTTPEAMMAMNGVFVQKTNHGGGSPFVRGVTGNQTLLLIDGIRLNNSTFRYGPNQYLNTIDAYSISKIEVAKGTGSVQYGTDAIGGVINLITNSPVFATDKSSFKAKAIAKYMTGDMEKTARAEAMYSSKRFALLAGFSKRNFGDIIGGDTTGRQSPSGYNEWAFDIKAAFLLKENIQLTVANQFLQQQHVPVYHKVQLENFTVNEMDPQQRLLSYARVNVKSRASLIKETEFTVSFQQGIEGRNSLKNGSTSLRKEKDNTKTVGITADILSAMGKNWTANSGIEIYTDKVNSSRLDINTQTNAVDTKRGLYPNNSKYGNYSLYSLHHFRLGKWIVDGGLRFNTFKINIPDTTLGSVLITPSALVINGALLYSISKQQTVYASFSSGYRAPNVDDMGTLGIVDFRYEVPTAGLQPERSQHSELGYKFQSKKISATFAAYYMHLSNLITRVKAEGQIINGYPVYKKENTEAAFIKGIETEFNAEVTQHVYFSSGISYTYGQSLSKHEPLRRIPPFNGRVTGTYKNNKWFAATEFQFASKQTRLAQGDKDDNRIGINGTAGWQVINCYAGYKLPAVNFNIGLQNVLNKDYRTHGSGINGVGRSGWVAISLKI
ncbi:TonB-dependent receptor plug domain-containing protein [Ferruginibacter sp.]|nr:TonB-dependent receptor [Ferruginibacter sp.]